MKREVENIPASIQARLKNKADESGRPFSELLQYYGMERFLYRLSKTSYVNDFILKGGLMFYGLEIPMRRTTRDIDFLGISEDTQRDVLSVFRNAISIPCPEDGVRFDSSTLRLSPSQVDENQGGLRVTFVGYLGKTRMPIQVDIGFSDELASEALNMDYPVLLAGMEKPHLRGYPLESIISEKLHAMTRFGEANSRWKDYYDIYLLANTFEFESQALSEAIKSTFNNRPSKLPDQIPVSLREEFAITNQESWETFLTKSKLRDGSIKELRQVVNKIWEFLEYPLREIQLDEPGKPKRWNRSDGWE
jgi:predicted nucleotidyltransferase component of viral defense system